MTSNVKLLPLPCMFYNLFQEEVDEAVQDYARACVEANLAAKQAEHEQETEALRAEVRELKADRDSWEQQASDRVADWHDEYKRAERLAEALREASAAQGDDT